MNYEVIVTEPFERKAKKLSKKYRSLKSDLSTIIELLTDNPKQGRALGKDCYKIRLSISSKGKGKSGGARIITFVRIVNKRVYLLDIYDKNDKESISDKELRLLIKLLNL